jgi:hypothetical protein
MSTDQRLFPIMFIVNLLIYSSEITLLYYTWFLHALVQVDNVKGAPS